MLRMIETNSRRGAWNTAPAGDQVELGTDHSNLPASAGQGRDWIGWGLMALALASYAGVVLWALYDVEEWLRWPIF